MYVYEYVYVSLFCHTLLITLNLSNWFSCIIYCLFSVKYCLKFQLSYIYLKQNFKIVPKCCQDLIGIFISFHYNMLNIYVLLWKYYDNMK